jgi:hypothetical protein
MCVSILCFVIFSSLIFTRAINGVLQILASGTADGTWEENRKNANKITSAGAKNVFFAAFTMYSFPVHTPIWMVPRAHCSEINRPGREADHSPPQYRGKNA